MVTARGIRAGGFILRQTWPQVGQSRTNHNKWTPNAMAIQNPKTNQSMGVSQIMVPITALVREDFG